VTNDSTVRNDPKSTLQGLEVHGAWIRHFRTPENDRFYGLAFDFVAESLGPPGDHPVVDAGCGSAHKSVLLARRGYQVVGVDFSDAILEEARAAVAASGFAGQVTLQVEDLTSLHFPARSARSVVCWGVLMHVPEVEVAVAELARIVAPGGTLVVSEGNFRSVQSVCLRCIKRVIGHPRSVVTRTRTGIETWETTDSGRLMTRQADVPWLVAEFQRHGLQLTKRRAGQFTEIYTLFRWKPLRSFIHAFNDVWFRWIRWGGPAFGNILVFVRHV
jgi:ubiquinone/menaquinone biosynthesis C-methylase UbiE